MLILSNSFRAALCPLDNLFQVSSGIFCSAELRMFVKQSFQLFLSLPRSPCSALSLFFFFFSPVHCKVGRLEFYVDAVVCYCSTTSHHVSLSACSLPSDLQWELVIKHSNQSYVWSKAIVFLSLLFFLVCFFFFLNSLALWRHSPPSRNACSDTPFFFSSVAEMEDSAPSFICVGFQCLQPDDQDGEPP